MRMITKTWGSTTRSQKLTMTWRGMTLTRSGAVSRRAPTERRAARFVARVGIGEDEQVATCDLISLPARPGLAEPARGQRLAADQAELRESLGGEVARDIAGAVGLSSSTTMISRSDRSNVVSEATHAPMLKASLRAGTITETSGDSSAAGRGSSTRRGWRNRSGAQHEDQPRQQPRAARSVWHRHRAACRTGGAQLARRACRNPGCPRHGVEFAADSLARMHELDAWRDEFPILRARTI
jgi:hypothetical protein